jgi:hypothetical protein
MGGNNPNTPSNQDFCFKITRNPVENTGNPVETPMGHTGVWKNGVSLFNAKDAFTYNDQGVWFQDAYVFEGASFDECLGHPAGNGEYHHHINPTCLYDDSDSDNHSPIIGYAFDGFPFYGAYGYENTDGTGEIIRMRTSFQHRDIEVRQTLPGGEQLSSTEYGPPVNGTYPIGSFLEDYEYLENSGELDEHNGRFCVTPEYPEGTYAYFVTIDENLDPLYPYAVGPTYYGIVQPGNTGPQSAHNIIPLNATHYDPTDGLIETPDTEVQVYPNPVSDILNISSEGSMIVRITDLQSRDIYSAPGNHLKVDVSGFRQGVYIVTVGTISKQVVVVH